jgi:arabinogalactan endo-1,4-beta-galactosidase
MCLRKTARRGSNAIYLAAAIAAAPLVHSATAVATPFFMGSDISLETFMQQEDVPFKDNSVAMDADQILYNNGDNLFRLRLFVNPQTTYTNSNVGAIQTQAYDIALAQQIKANDPSAKIELDLHYSDTWASPGAQATPSEWSAANTLALMQTQVYNYTYNTVQAFQNAGVAPDIVEIGNETNDGMLWPLGTISFSGSTASQEASWANFGSLIVSAANAVHAAQGNGPKILTSMTIGNGNSSGEPAYFYNNLFSPSYGDVPESDVNIMGLDYYPSTHDESTLMSNINTLTADIPNKNVMLMETDAPYISNNSDKSLAHDTTYAETQAGQASYFSALASDLQTNPNVIGLLYWYPESVQVSGYNIYNGGDTALFDSNGNALQTIVGTATAGQNANGDFSITQHQWNTAGSSTWETAGNWETGSPNAYPNAPDAEADFLGLITSSQTVSTSTSLTVGTVRFDNTNTYTIAGTGSLSLDATLGWSYIVVQAGAQQINIPLTVQSSASLAVATGCSLSFGAPVTVNAGQILVPAGSGTINYNSTISLAANANMTVANSTHSTGLTVAATATMALAGAGTSFEVDSLVNNGTILVNSTNATSSTLVVNGAMSGTGTVSVPGGGLLAFSPNIGSSTLGSLNLTGNGKFDLNNNVLFIDYGSGPDPISSIVAWIGNGYYGRAGPQIISSAIATDDAVSGLSYGIGYADGAEGVIPGLPSGEIEIMFTLLGDANLDGTVNAEDYTPFSHNIGQSGMYWDDGDFNYDGTVNAEDYTSFSANIGQSATLADGAMQAANGLAAVPEPATTSIAAIALSATLVRRKRNRHDSDETTAGG